MWARAGSELCGGQHNLSFDYPFSGWELHTEDRVNVFSTKGAKAELDEQKYGLCTLLTLIHTLVLVK